MSAQNKSALEESLCYISGKDERTTSCSTWMRQMPSIQKEKSSCSTMLSADAKDIRNRTCALQTPNSMLPENGRHGMKNNPAD